MRSQGLCNLVHHSVQIVQVTGSSCTVCPHHDAAWPNPPSVNVTRVKSPPSDVTSHKSRPHHALIPALKLNLIINIYHVDFIFFEDK